MSEELKPCPFCGGGDAHLISAPIERNGDGLAYIVCWCDARGPAVDLGYCLTERDGTDEAAELWNTRPSALPIGDVRDGWVLVPVEPTEAMLLAGARAQSPALFKHGLHSLPGDGENTKRQTGDIVQRARAMYAAFLSARPLGDGSERGDGQ